MKPKAFWIFYHDKFEDGEDTVLQTKPDETEGWTHVVEYSAYEKLRKDFKSLTSQMRKGRRWNIPLGTILKVSIAEKDLDRIEKDAGL